MTANQISFYRAKEEAKHWKRQDKENRRHNVQSESISHEMNYITDWANKANAAHLERSDAINRAHYERMDSENHRSNVAQEAIKSQQNQIDYLNYLVNRDYKSGMLDVEERGVSVKEGQLANDTLLNGSKYDLNVSQAYLNRVKAGTEKTKQLVNEADVGLKESKEMLNYTNVVTDVTHAVNDTFKSIIKVLPWE